MSEPALARGVSHLSRIGEIISQDAWVLNCVRGYTINLLSKPPKELNFSKEETLNLSKEVQNMVEKNAISRVYKEQEGFQSQLFVVRKKDGGQRPIINLKKLNSFVQTEHFKMKGIHMLKDFLKPGDWMTKVDLKDAYFMIPVATNHRRLLQFKWLGKTYQFNCLPFGLSLAPWVFTNTTKAIVAIFRTTGRIFWLYSGLHNNGDETTKREKQEDKDGNHETKTPGQPSSHYPVKTTGQTQSCHTGNPTCSSVLLQLTVLLTRSPGGGRPRPCDTGQTNTEMHRGKAITSDGGRCINHRLGGYMRGSPDRGTLVRDQESFAH